MGPLLCYTNRYIIRRRYYILPFVCIQSYIHTFIPSLFQLLIHISLQRLLRREYTFTLWLEADSSLACLPACLLVCLIGRGWFIHTAVRRDRHDCWRHLHQSLCKHIHHPSSTVHIVSLSHFINTVTSSLTHSLTHSLLLKINWNNQTRQSTNSKPHPKHSIILHIIDKPH
jgi:hypothetical protein